MGEGHKVAKPELGEENTHMEEACHGVSEPRVKREFLQRALQVWALET